MSGGSASVRAGSLELNTEEGNLNIRGLEEKAPTVNPLQTRDFPEKSGHLRGKVAKKNTTELPQYSDNRLAKCCGHNSTHVHTS